MKRLVVIFENFFVILAFPTDGKAFVLYTNGSETLIGASVFVSFNTVLTLQNGDVLFLGDEANIVSSVKEYSWLENDGLCLVFLDCFDYGRTLRLIVSFDELGGRILSGQLSLDGVWRSGIWENVLITTPFHDIKEGMSLEMRIPDGRICSFRYIVRSIFS